MSPVKERYEVVLSIQGFAGFPVHGGIFKISATLIDVTMETKEIMVRSSRFSNDEDLIWSLSKNFFRHHWDLNSLINVNIHMNRSLWGSFSLELRDVLSLNDMGMDSDGVLDSQYSRVSEIRTLDQRMCSKGVPTVKWFLTLKSLEKENKEDLSKEETHRDSGQGGTPEVTLNKEKGYFQIGSHPTHLYELRIEIFFASLLHLAISKDRIKEASNGRLPSFHFSYKLFGETIRTNSIRNLEDSNFELQEVCFRIHSDLPSLIRFFNDQPPLRVSLCSEEEQRELAGLTFSMAIILKLEEALTDPENMKRYIHGCQVSPFESSKDSTVGLLLLLQNKGALSELQVMNETHEVRDTINDGSHEGSSSLLRGHHEGISLREPSLSQENVQLFTSVLYSTALEKDEEELDILDSHEEESQSSGREEVQNSHHHDATTSLIESLRNRIRELEVLVQEKEAIIQELRLKAKSSSRSL